MDCEDGCLGFSVSSAELLVSSAIVIGWLETSEKL
jgi:hypothetical protein